MAMSLNKIMNHTMKKTLILYLGLLLLAACSTEEETVVFPQDQLANLEFIEDASTFNAYLRINGTRPSSDPFTILEVDQNGSNLRVKVEYLGGDKPHNFKVIWSGQYPDSSPAELPLIIAHDAQGDQGQNLIQDVLNIDTQTLFANQFDPATDKLLIINGSNWSVNPCEISTFAACHELGIVRDVSGLDGCGFIIELQKDQGDRIEPVIICDSTFSLQDNQTVLFSYIPLEVLTTCISGQPAAINCIREANPVEGTIRDFRQLDGCAWIIELKDGTRLEPINQEVTNWVDGQKVWIEYTPVDAGSICMAGQTVRIDWLQVKP